jgi:four helix bundle protein
MKDRLSEQREAKGELSCWPTDLPRLPHHKLKAYAAVRELLRAVLRADIDDVDLRNQAVRAAKSACCNTAEGAGKVSRRDKARSFGIARAEAVEAAATTELAADCGHPAFYAAVAVNVLPARAGALHPAHTRGCAAAGGAAPVPAPPRQGALPLPHQPAQHHVKP